MSQPDSYHNQLVRYVKDQYAGRLNAICPDEKYYACQQSFTNFTQLPVEVIRRTNVEYAIDAASYDQYAQIFRECVKRGYTTVYDIGASSGAQANIIAREKLPLQYVAVEPADIVPLHDYPIIKKAYPCKIKPAPNSIAVSVLCVGVLYNSDDTDNRVMQQLLTDFDALILTVDAANNQRLIKSIPNTCLSDGVIEMRFFDASQNKVLQKIATPTVAPMPMKDFCLPIERKI